MGTAVPSPIMFGKFKPVLKQARTLIEEGQLEAAARLLADPDIAAHRDARTLIQELTQNLLRRASRHIARGALLAACEDLGLARSLTGNAPELVEAADQLAQAAARQLRDLLHAGRPEQAWQLAEMLRSRRFDHPELQPWVDAAATWRRARRAARDGNLIQAVFLLKQAHNTAPNPGLARELDELEQRLDRVRTLETELAQALESQNWAAVLTVATQILKEQPNHPAALAARQRAWKAVALIGGTVNMTALQEGADPPAADISGQQVELLVDGGGSYLVIPADEIVIGSVAGNAQVKLLANVSRRHVQIVRDREGYVAVPLKPIQVDGKTVRQPTSLRDGMELALTEAARFRFRLPSPVCRSAVLVPEDPSFLPGRYDAIVFLARFCFLGEDAGCHIYAPETPRWTVAVAAESPLQLRFRGPGRLQVGHEEFHGEAVITPPARVVLPTASLTVVPPRDAPS